MKFTVAAIFSTAATVALSMPTSEAPAKEKRYVGGACGIHVTQWQKNENGVGSQYEFTVDIKDALGNGVGGVYLAPIADYQTLSINSELPFPLTVTAGGVDSDPVDFSYDGYYFSSSNGCSLGGHGPNALDSFRPVGNGQQYVDWYQAPNPTCQGNACPIAAWADGKIWIFDQYLLPEYREQPLDQISKFPDSAWERHHILCESYNASFNIQRTYSSLQEDIVGNVTLLNPLNYSQSVMQGLNDMSPEYAGYAIHQILYSTLSGHIGPNGRSMPEDTTKLLGTRVVEDTPIPLLNNSQGGYPNNPGYTGIRKPVRNLAHSIMDFHFNVTVGMLSIPNLVYLQNETASATTITLQTQWSYNWLPLAATYAAFFALGILAIILAAVAISDNNGTGISDTGFLRDFLTTRHLHNQINTLGSIRGEDYDQADFKRVIVEFDKSSPDSRY